MISHKLINNLSAVPAAVANLRCPHCGHVGAFPGVGNVTDVAWLEQAANLTGLTSYTAGIRRCPNRMCCCLVFVILKAGALEESFPPEVIDFDSTNLPPPILASLEEAIKAHSAECFKASALMVRRVLEELCDDKKATGSDLKARLANLSKNVVIPSELLDAADELRLLGNDAAHVKAQNYDAIGKTEAALAIELAKELLKAVYQYTSLVSKLKALKKP